ncbi:MAG TPA: hypothetical protein VHX14_16195 [Thermoanaerobaculia bacterium]|nr:hypothetical protein [Thermoanaerobaculia bacterium]
MLKAATLYNSLPLSSPAKTTLAPSLSSLSIMTSSSPPAPRVSWSFRSSVRKSLRAVMEFV